MEKKPSVGFIGLGAMGSSVAKHLVAAGYPLVLYDVRQEAMAGFPERVLKASSSFELGNVVDVCFLMVNTYEQCLNVLTGNDGLLRGLQCRTLILLSTIAPHDAVSIEKECDKTGVEVLDCPVSGGTKGALEGTLTLMVSGSRVLFETCEAMLRSFSRQIFFIGEAVGLGQSMKAVNQLLFGVHMVAMAEAVSLGENLGLSLESIYEVVSQSSGASHVFMSRMPTVIKRDFSTRSTLDIQVKDMKICLDTAERRRAPLFLAPVAKELFTIAENHMDSKEDSSAVLKLYEKLSALHGDHKEEERT